MVPLAKGCLETCFRSSCARRCVTKTKRGKFKKVKVQGSKVVVWWKREKISAEGTKVVTSCMLHTVPSSTILKERVWNKVPYNWIQYRQHVSSNAPAFYIGICINNSSIHRIHYSTHTKYKLPYCNSNGNLYLGLSPYGLYQKNPSNEPVVEPLKDPVIRSI